MQRNICCSHRTQLLQGQIIPHGIIGIKHSTSKATSSLYGVEPCSDGIQDKHPSTVPLLSICQSFVCVDRIGHTHSLNFLLLPFDSNSGLSSHLCHFYITTVFIIKLINKGVDQFPWPVSNSAYLCTVLIQPTMNTISGSTSYISLFLKIRPCSLFRDDVAFSKIIISNPSIFICPALPVGHSFGSV